MPAAASSCRLTTPRATLLRMAAAIGAPRSRPRRSRWAIPSTIPIAAERLAGRERGDAGGACARRRFIWITGNHDPQPPAWLGGAVTEEWREGGLIFRHEPRRDAEPARSRGICILAPRSPNGAAACGGAAFAADGRRMILPSFGAYTGGLDVGEPRSPALFGARFHAYHAGRGAGLCHSRDIQAGRRKSSDEIQPMISAITTAARP